jgi:hypothetical protein
LRQFATPFLGAFSLILRISRKSVAAKKFDQAGKIHFVKKQENGVNPEEDWLS